MKFSTLFISLAVVETGFSTAFLLVNEASAKQAEPQILLEEQALSALPTSITPHIVNDAQVNMDLATCGGRLGGCDDDKTEDYSDLMQPDLISRCPGGECGDD